jgi:hypothetical protein
MKGDSQNWMMGKFLPETHGKPKQFDGKKPWKLPLCRFSLKKTIH